MTRKELLELACWDALGLLDGIESEFYTRAFHNEPAHVQNHIKRLQAEIVSNLPLPDDEEPAPSLRARVLEAVAKAIEREEAHLAPIAQIGPRRRAAVEAGRRFVFNPSGQLWRAAAFALAGVGVVFAIFYAEARQHANKVAEIALSNNTATVLEELIGPTVKDFLFDPSTNYIVLHPSRGLDVRAVVCVNEGTGEAFLVTDRLDQAGTDTYTLRYVDDSGTHNLRRFGSSGGVQGIRLGTLSVAAFSAIRWEVVNSASIVVLASA